jgi:tRNA pseudouridine38-40 synthase
MPRIALGLEYDGTDFVGWQSQRNGRSVADTVAAAVSAVAGQSVQVHGAGRTDTGVHASAQVAHFDTTVARTPRQWLLGINSNLPPDVAVRWVHPVAEDFDARRCALARRYRYVIVGGATRPVLERRTVWWQREPLDCAAMTQAAVCWIGEHDFSAFRAANCQSATPMRRVRAIRIACFDRRVEIEVTANAFLYHMVRNMVGVLVEIGRGRAPPAWAAELLAGRDRTKSAATAPACGLTLVDVEYADECGLPAAPDRAERS